MNDTKPTLLILAAGIGSRYGGIKQLDKFGPNGETIIDYSLYDAIRAGFGKVVFIVRKEILEDVRSSFAPKLTGHIDFDFAIQGYESYVPERLGTVERSKPWGTGHAMLCAWEQTSTPFAIINADDFYGLEAFETMCRFLSNDDDPTRHAMVGYELKRTLSENGTVSRGVCAEDASGHLITVIERTKILKKDGKIFFDEEGVLTELAPETPVSMNFWGFKPGVFPITKALFDAYAEKNMDNPKAEFYIPTVMSDILKKGQGSCKVFKSQSDWFGVTYPEDKPVVQEQLNALHARNAYPSSLWG
jgi:NDP-sugar pyrophosphorylase family protein